MAKILVSFLGTGRISASGISKREYETAKYDIKGKIYEETLIARALDSHYNIDKVFYIGTLKSMWEEVYKSYSSDDLNADTYFSLGAAVESFDRNTPIEKAAIIKDAFSKQDKLVPIIIKYGVTKEELNYNIEQILEIEHYIASNDEVYIDITHGFRSLPLIVMNVFNYLADVSNKNFRIAGISYGMFEAKDTESGVTPVVDLDLVNELHQNVKAAHEFNHYGNAYLFSELVADNCKSMSRILKDFSISKSLNHIYDLKQKIQQFNSFKSEYENLTTVQRLTIPKTIESFVKRFDKAKKDSHYQYEISKWMMDHKEYGFASISLVESIVTKVCELAKLNPTSKVDREFAKLILRESWGKSDSKNQYKLNTKLTDIQKGILSKAKLFNEYAQIHTDVNKIRNNSSHSISSTSNVNQVIAKIKNNIDLSERLIYSRDIIE